MPQRKLEYRRAHHPAAKFLSHVGYKRVKAPFIGSFDAEMIPIIFVNLY